MKYVAVTRGTATYTICKKKEEKDTMFTTSTVFSQYALITMGVLPAVLILADVITGSISAWKKKTFELKKLAEFLQNDVMRYIGAICMTAISWLTTGTMTAADITGIPLMAVLCTSIAHSIVQNIAEIFPMDQAVDFTFEQDIDDELDEIFRMPEISIPPLDRRQTSVVPTPLPLPVLPIAPVKMPIEYQETQRVPSISIPSVEKKPQGLLQHTVENTKGLMTA